MNMAYSTNYHEGRPVILRHYNPEFIHILWELNENLGNLKYKNPSRSRQYQEARYPKEMTGNLIINIIKNLDRPFLKTLTFLFAFVEKNSQAILHPTAFTQTLLCF